MKIDVTITQDELRELVAIKLNINVNCVGMITVERPDASTVESNPWYPDDSGEWIEHVGIEVPAELDDEQKIQWLTRSERDTKGYYYSTDYPYQLSWSELGENTIVAYKPHP